MNLYTEIQDHFTDGNGLVTPGRYTPGGNGQGSDNGVMFTSEFYALLKKHRIAIDHLVDDYGSVIRSCIDPHGNLRRVPYPTKPGQSNRQQGPDDYLAVLNTSKALGITSIPRTFLKALLKQFGSLNNESPGKFSWRGLLIRQPQILTAMITAAFPKMTPLHTGIRLFFFPLYVYTAVVIGTSCRNKEILDSDSRRLSWHLVQIVKDRSILCWLGSKLWYKKLYDDYGNDPMNTVARIYYGNGHPFVGNWKAE